MNEKRKYILSLEEIYCPGNKEPTINFFEYGEKITFIDKEGYKRSFVPQFDFKEDSMIEWAFRMLSNNRRKCLDIKGIFRRLNKRKPYSWSSHDKIFLYYVDGVWKPIGKNKKDIKGQTNIYVFSPDLWWKNREMK